MSLHKMCAHAVLSVALISSATSQAFNLQVPSMTQNQMIGCVAGLGLLGVVGYYGKKAFLANKEMRKEAGYFRMLKNSYGPQGTENNIEVSKKDRLMAPQWVLSVRPVLTAEAQRINQNIVKNGGKPRGDLGCVRLSTDMYDEATNVDDTINHCQ